MFASPILWVVPIFAIFASAYCFRVGQELSFTTRMAASAHGVLAAAVVPAAVYGDKALLSIKSQFAGSVLVGTTVLAISSLIFAFIKLRGSGSLLLTKVLMIPVIVVHYLAGGVIVFGIH